MCPLLSIQNWIQNLRIAALTLVYLFALGFAMCDRSFADSPSDKPETVPEIPSLDASSNALSSEVSADQQVLYKILVAELAAQRHMPEIALKNYIEVARETRNVTIAKEATEWAIEFQAPEQALQASEIWASLAKDDLQAQMVAATLVIGQSINQAMPYLTRAIELNPKEIGQHMIAIQGRLSARSAEHLKMALYRIAAKRPEDPYANLVAAQSAVQQEDIESANRWTDKALNLMPSLTQAIELKAKLIRHADNSDTRALKFLKNNVQKYANDGELRLFYASALLDANQLKEAITHLKLLTSDKAYGGQSFLLLGEIFRKQGDIEAATTAWKNATKYEESADNAHFLLGELSEQLGKTDDAVEWYTAIRSGGFHITAQIRAAEILKDNKEYAKAIAVLHESTPTTIDEQKEVLLSEANILVASKQLNDALTLTEEVLAKIPNDEDFLLAHSQIAAKLKKWSLAEKDLKMIIKQNPNNAEALNSLGYILSLQKDRINEAKQYLEQALSLAPKNPSYLDSMGWYYFRIGELSSALPYLKQANELSNDPEIAAHLGEVLWAMGRQEDAKSIWSKAIKKTPESEILLETLNRFNVAPKGMKTAHH